MWRNYFQRRSLDLVKKVYLVFSLFDEKIEINSRYLESFVIQDFSFFNKTSKYKKKLIVSISN